MIHVSPLAEYFVPNSLCKVKHLKTQQQEHIVDPAVF